MNPRELGLGGDLRIRRDRTRPARRRSFPRKRRLDPLGPPRAMVRAASNTGRRLMSAGLFLVGHHSGRRDLIGSPPSAISTKYGGRPHHPRANLGRGFCPLFGRGPLSFGPAMPTTMTTFDILIAVAIKAIRIVVIALYVLGPRRALRRYLRRRPDRLGGIAATQPAAHAMDCPPGGQQCSRAGFPTRREASAWLVARYREQREREA